MLFKRLGSVVCRDESTTAVATVSGELKGEKKRRRSEKTQLAAQKRHYPNRQRQKLLLFEAAGAGSSPMNYSAWSAVSAASF